MKSIEALKYKYNLSNKQLLKAMRNCISYHLSEEELEVFIHKVKGVTK